MIPIEVRQEFCRVGLSESELALRLHVTRGMIYEINF